MAMNDCNKIVNNKDGKEDDNPSTFVLPNCLGNGTHVIYKGMWLPQINCSSESFLNDLEGFQFKDDDILVATFPKSGTTWVQEIISQIESLYRENGKEWKSIKVEDRFPMLEYSNHTIKYVEEMKSPRLIKTHLSYNALPVSIRNCSKIIYVARDPRDVCVSLYHFLRMFTPFSYRGPFQEFFDYFIRRKTYYGPWEDHVMSFLERKNDENLLFITYERIHKETKKVIKEISNFINKPITDEQLNNIVDATKFDNMKNDPSTNYSSWEDGGKIDKNEGPFCRKGIVGDFKNYMDDFMMEEIGKLFRLNPALMQLFN